MADEITTNGNGNSADVYSLRPPSTLTETVIVPSDTGDIFAIKKENASQLGSLIGMALSEGVFLCQAYRLDKLLSRDETGEIWKASDLQESRNVIVYLPPPAIRKDETTIEPMRQHARQIEALEHPRIVPLLDNFTDPEHGFFTIRKFVNGKTLADYRTDYVKRHGKLTPIKIVKILGDIAHALDYAHGVDVVHGDLCLKNIIVGLDDEVYLDSFALVPVQVENASVERKPYLAPEVLEGNAATAPSDIYALAVIAYNLLSGRLPFTPETVDNTPPPIPGVTSAVDDILRKALTKEPDDRYDSCGTFVKILEASFQESKKIKSVTVIPVSSPSRKNTSSRRTFWLALVGLLGIVGGVAALQFLPTSIQEPPPVGVEVTVPLIDEPAPKPEPERTVDPEPQVSPPETPPVQPDAPIVTPVNTIEEAVVIPEVSPVMPQPLQEEPTTPVPPSEPEPPQDDAISPPLPPEEPPVVEDNVDGIVPQPQQETTESERTVSPSLADTMREEGDTVKIVIGGVGYRFYWCKLHLLGFNGFWIQETPVTQESWREVMEKIHPQPADGRQLPVSSVSQNECNEFIVLLNAHPEIPSGEEFDVESEYRFALPSVAQWEHAYGKGLLTDKEVKEWCSDVNVQGQQAIRSRSLPSAHENNWRYPRDQGYSDVGFRLIIGTVQK